MSNRKRFSAGFLSILMLLGCREKFSSEPAQSAKEKRAETIIQPKYVSSSNGLILREKPSARSKKIAILPFRMQLNNLIESHVCENIAGKDGCWEKYSRDKVTGWVFNGYLSSYQPMMTQVQYGHLATKYCAGLSNFCECVTKIENEELPKYPNLSRKDKTITIRLDTGKEVSLTDTSPADKYDVATSKFRFERKENGFYIFQVCCWEWSERHIINGLTGTAIRTFGEQIFSPDGKYMLSFSDEIFSRNGIEIFDLSAENPKKVFSIAPPGVSMRSISWKANDLIEIIDANSEKARFITLKNSVWSIE
ncbi:MAG: SH3 domain-containing protein [Spirochaetes bacterium]|nr:SH3 domain-containing protein [Spirochaetota bacterium]